MNKILKFAVLLCLLFAYVIYPSVAHEDEIREPTEKLKEMANIEEKKHILFRSIPVVLASGYFGYLGFCLKEDIMLAFADAVPVALVTLLYLKNGNDITDVEHYLRVLSILSIIHLLGSYTVLAVVDVFNGLTTVQHVLLRIIFHVMLAFYFGDKWDYISPKLASPSAGIKYAVDKLGEIGNRLALFNTLLLLPGAIEKTFNAFNPA